MSKSMWTRTTTLLPNKGDLVLACFIGEQGRRIIRVALYDDPILGIDDEPFEGCSEEEPGGEIRCPIGFYEIEPYYHEMSFNYWLNSVTHWQPLPPLPEE